MPYVKNPTWNSGLAPGIDADKLNNLETQYEEAAADLATHALTVNTHGDITSSGANIEDAVTKRHNQTHGVADHTDVTRYKFYSIMGAEHDGVAKAFERYPSIELALGTDENLRIGGAAPPDYSATVAVYIVWACNDGNNVRFQLLNNYGTAGQAHDVHGEDSGAFLDGGGGAGVTNWSTVAGTPLASLAKADTVAFHLVRWGAHGDDTAGHIWVLGIMLAYTAEQ